MKVIKIPFLESDLADSSPVLYRRAVFESAFYVKELSNSFRTDNIDFFQFSLFCFCFYLQIKLLRAFIIFCFYQNCNQSCCVFLLFFFPFFFRFLPRPISTKRRCSILKLMDVISLQSVSSIGVLLTRHFLHTAHGYEMFRRLLSAMSVQNVLLAICPKNGTMGQMVKTVERLFQITAR